MVQMASITIDLPMPPSTNSIWRRGWNRKTGQPVTYLNKTYKDWKLRADAELEKQHPGPRPLLTGAFNVRLVLAAHKRFKMDLDNRIKAALDWAKQAGLIADDKYQNRVTLEWGDVPSGARITLEDADVSLDVCTNSRIRKNGRKPAPVS